MSRKASFTAIPVIPQGGGLSPWLFNTLTAMKENIELLMGARGVDNNAQAVLRGQLSVANPPTQQMTRVSADASGYTISGANVPSLDDYRNLVSDVQTLANDVAALHVIMNTLINQLKG